MNSRNSMNDFDPLGTGCLFFLFFLQAGEGQGQLHMAFLLLVVKARWLQEHQLPVCSYNITGKFIVSFYHLVQGQCFQKDLK